MASWGEAGKLLGELRGRAEAELAQGLHKGGLFVLASVLARLGEDELALGWLNHYLAAFSDDTEALRLKARLLKRLGRLGELSEWLQFLSREDPRVFALMVND